MEKRCLSKLLTAAVLFVSSILLPAQAGVISVKAADLATISAVGSFGGRDGRLNNELYMLAESQGAPWLSYGLLKFDLSQFASSSLATDGEFKLSVATLWPGSQMSVNFSLHTLLQTYDPTTVSLNNYGGYGQQVATASNTFSNINGPVNGQLSFKLSKTLLQSWINNPSSNHGLLLRFTSYSSNKIHSDLTFTHSGNQAPSLTFTVAEPAGLLLPFCAFGLLLMRRRHIKQ